MIDFDKVLDRHNTNTWKWDGEGLNMLYPMGTADMDFHMPEEVEKAIHDKVSQGILSYAADKSYFGKAFAKSQERRHGLHIEPEWVVPGTALMAVYKVIMDAFTAPGDGVIVQTPVFGPLYTAVENAGRRMYDNPLIFDAEKRTWHVDYELLEKQCADPRTRMLVICNPGNPVTKAFTRDEMQTMYNIAVKNDVIVMSDEIHSDIYYDGREHVSILNVADEEKHNAVVLTSSGKVFGIPGLKTAATVIPNDRLRARFSVANMNAKMDVIDLGLVASVAGYEHADEYLVELNKYLQGNKDYVVKWFDENDIDVTLTSPEASYLFWLDFTKWGKTCSELEHLLGEYGIVFSSGTDFGGQHNEGFMRMNIATRHSQVVGALDALKKCWEETKD